MSGTVHRPDQSHLDFTRAPLVRDDFEVLDVGGGTPRPVLGRILVASTGAAVGALVVTVGPGLLTGSGMPAPARGEHAHTVVFRAVCSEYRCGPWTVRERPGQTLVTRISPGPNAAVVMHYLTHQDLP
jgi:hypothetical protein